MISLAVLLLLTKIILIKDTETLKDEIFQPDLENTNYPSLFRGIYHGCLCREYVFEYATCYNPERCRKFPRAFKTELTNFRLATTSVENITVKDLDNLTNLIVLQFEANNDLKWIEIGTFNNMSQLKSLSISYNPSLHYLEEDVFKGLNNLQNLTIQRNGFTDLKNSSLSLKSEFMPNLRKLELQLHCPSVDKDDFQNLNGSLLEELDLVDSQIEYIHPEALLPLRNLRTLNLGQNLINSTTLINLLEKIIENGIALKTLNLYGWGFKKELPKDVMEVISKSNITTLILNKNQFDIISKDTFLDMPHLESLYLSDVLLSNLTRDAFSGLPKLRTLCLSNNKFPSVPDGVLVHTLKELDLSLHSRHDVASYFTLDKYKFENMSNLEKLNLSSNNIRKIPQESFVGLINLKYLNMKDCNIFFIENKSFSYLKQLRFLSLEKNPFPARIFTKDIFDGLDTLEVLKLSYCGIKIIPVNMFTHLYSLTHLDLRGNVLKVINPNVFHPLKNLKNLDIGQNILPVWHSQFFHINNKITTLKADDNKITYFTKAMLEDVTYLQELDLSKNPFSCECKTFEDLSYFNASVVSHILHILSYIPSKCVYPDKYIEYSVIKYFNIVYLGNECNLGFIERLFDYLVPAIILLIIIIMVTVVAYVYRWHIRYWIFLTKMFLSRRAQFNKNVNLQGHDNYFYDAFVSYSSEDRNFVVRLVAMLENYEPFLKLCVYERDFEIGTIISESVLECVSRSRKTLLVISNSYIKSQWCRWEAQVAENHRLFFENENGECVNDSIIMIKLGNISQHNLSPMLKYLMKTRIYLPWDSEQSKQKQFWEKLRNALAPPSMPHLIQKIEGLTSETKG